MKAIAWQSGILICWYQGRFGQGGDTLNCNYYNLNGVSQWAQPTVAGNRQGSIIYVGTDNLDVYPNDSGATVTFELTESGGNNYFSFNRIDFSGNLRWPLDTFNYQGNGDYYDTGDDHHGGFYVATSTGGLGTDIYMGHFDFSGNLTIPTPIDISTGQGGRDEGRWKVLVGSDTAAYIVWRSSINNNISIAKIRLDGTLPWGDAKPICMAAGYQDYPDAMIAGDTIYAVWDDGRPGTTGYDIYMQKLDTAGNSFWTIDGIRLSHLSSYLPYPKLAASGNNVVATYEVNDGYRAQLVRPDSSTVWYQNGIVVNTNNPPFYDDYALVSSADGSVTSIWQETLSNICAARIRPDGILTAISEPMENTVRLFPNPAAGQFSLQIKGNDYAKAVISIYNAMGEIVLQKKNPDETSGIITVSTKSFSAGVYYVKVTGRNYNSCVRVCVTGE